MKELSSLRLRVVVLVYGLIVHNVQRAARLFSMRQSVGNLEPRVAVRHGSMLNLGHWATTELSSTVLSHIYIYEYKYIIYICIFRYMHIIVLVYYIDIRDHFKLLEKCGSTSSRRI